jgi:hypothetical protein
MQEITLLDELCEHINLYFQRFSKVSVNGLSKKIGLGEATLRRIIHGNLKKLPHPDNLIKTLQYIYREKDLNVLKEIVGGQLASYISQTFPIHDDILSFDKSIGRTLSEFVKIPGHFPLILMAATKSGVTKEEVIEKLGDPGRRAFETLLNNNYLIQRDESFFFEEENFNLHIKDFPTGLEKISHYLKPQDNCGNYFQSMQSLNQEGIDKVNRLMTNTLTEVFKIFGDEAYHGEQKYLVTAFADNFPNRN